MKRFGLGTLVAACAALGLMSAPALAASASGVQHLHFAAGPYLVRSGANSIFLDGNSVPKPKVDGYMIRMAPNLHYALGSRGHLHCCGAIPRVDVIHLHHGVWLSNGRAGQGEGNGSYGGFYPFMATGEEKTTYELPKGFGYPVGAKDTWWFNYMIHNLWPQQAYVYVTYDMDFVPLTSPLAKTITPVHPIWMDVESGEIYPVFNVYRNSGKHGRFTFPEMAKNPYPAPGRAKNQFVVDHPGTLIATAAHVHPGGLFGQLDLTRAGAVPSGGALPGMTPGSVRLFRSNAHYWDPRGPISWDMAMQGTSPDWRPYLKAGDTLSVSATYETRRASWYESMGIMVAWEAWDKTKGATDPFSHKLDQSGHLTHGHLAENNHHGGTLQVGQNPKTMRNCTADQVTIRHYQYNPGGFFAAGKNDCIPTIRQGQTVTFVNQDAPNSDIGFLNPNSWYGKAIFHTVTSCQNPCGRDTGISYPLAQGGATFDSGQLGLGNHPPETGFVDWSTPKGLKPGVYTYYCRIHPFMRGVFRVIK
jgi:plastocyanin